MDSQTEQQLVIRADFPDCEPEMVVAWQRSLGRDLYELGVREVQFAGAGPAPAGTMAGEALDWNTIVVTLLASGGLLVSLVNLIGERIRQNAQRSVTLEMDGDKLTLTGSLTDAQLQRLVEQWIERHGRRRPAAKKASEAR